jgi:hypothetical protein
MVHLREVVFQNWNAHHSVLGVVLGAYSDDVKAAYRKGSLRTHPDKGGDAEEFKAISDAYDILMNPNKARVYNEFAHYSCEALDEDLNSFYDDGSIWPFVEDAMLSVDRLVELLTIHSVEGLADAAKHCRQQLIALQEAIVDDRYREAMAEMRTCGGRSRSPRRTVCVLNDVRRKHNGTNKRGHRPANAARRKQPKYWLFAAANDGCVHCVQRMIQDEGVDPNSKSENCHFNTRDWAVWAVQQGRDAQGVIDFLNRHGYAQR